MGKYFLPDVEAVQGTEVVVEGCNSVMDRHDTSAAVESPGKPKIDVFRPVFKSIL